MDLKERSGGERRGFNIVCKSCGSLSIKADCRAADAPDTTLVECGRCGAMRGTFAELQVLARSGRDLFEF
jgi:hypothetical protein